MNIRRGDRGDTVSVLQRALNARGFNLEVDGIFGAHTEEAVKTFQRQNGLDDDGIAGKNTLAALGLDPDTLVPIETVSGGLTESSGSFVPAESSKYVSEPMSNDETGGEYSSTEADFSEGESATCEDPGLEEIEFPIAPSSRPAYVLGLDTASIAGNRDPDWIKASQGGSICFAIIRSNYGDARDRVFARDWPKLMEAGITRGAYLFLRFPHPKRSMNPPDPVSQAGALIQTVGPLNESDLPPTVDVEFPGGRRLTGLSAQQCLDRVRSAWAVLRDFYGVAPIIYTSARVWREDLDNLSAPDLAESPLWLARYPFKKGPAVRDERVMRANPPPVPPPWGDTTNWWIHQYQGDAVGLPGFRTGHIDMDRFNVMMKGEAGARVLWMQRRLGIAENGTFDDETEYVLRQFQESKGVVPDGQVDPRTFAFLCWANP